VTLNFGVIFFDWIFRGNTCKWYCLFRDLIMDSNILPNPPLPTYRLRIRVWIIVWLLYFYSRWFVYDNYYSWLDTINFLVHEAGHPIMGMFWEFIWFLWGTLFQLLIPGAFFVYFFTRRANIAWQLCLFWVWESLLNISIYAWDAVNQLLPLWDPNGSHDWTYLLDKMWVLAHADTVGKMIFIFGSILIFFALWIMFYDGFKRQPITIWYWE